MTANEVAIVLLREATDEFYRYLLMISTGAWFPAGMRLGAALTALLLGGAAIVVACRSGQHARACP